MRSHKEIPFKIRTCRVFSSRQGLQLLLKHLISKLQPTAPGEVILPCVKTCCIVVQPVVCPENRYFACKSAKRTCMSITSETWNKKHKDIKNKIVHALAWLQLAWLIVFASLSFSMAFSTLPALPSNVTACWCENHSIALKFILIFPFAFLTCAMTELWPQSGFRNKTACAPFEIPESKGRDGVSCPNTLQLGLEPSGQISEIHHFVESIRFLYHSPGQLARGCELCQWWGWYSHLSLLRLGGDVGLNPAV